ncbi:MAG: DUF58 domain-containing protein [Fulvivirga sp.]|uniref:DUF58 domain-containing protein n=1 Tax=Fulvivirga sp. TaxID=1931237 RepID=UPI0032EDB077
MRLIRIIQSLYLTFNFYASVGLLVLVFVLGSMNPFILGVANGLLFLFILAILFEVVQLFRIDGAVKIKRISPERLSNGDENNILVQIKSQLPYDCKFTLIDELPIQFQSRDKTFKGDIAAGKKQEISYTIRPFERGEYHFGNINLYLSTFAHLIQRRYQSEAGEMTKVYPSINQVKKYSFLAVSDRLYDAGIKKIRKIGHNYEFDQIREFIVGDDIRAINWKATARTSHLMVNQYQDEKSQEVYVIINKGRVMQMPFEQLSLLDYSINSGLVMLNTAYVKDDYPGLICFNKEVDLMVSASKKKSQITLLLEALYNQETDFSEANYSKLAFWIRKTIKKRTLLFLYTNFEGLSSLKREIDHLKAISKYQRLIVVIFKNVELDALIEQKSDALEDIYTKTIAIKFKTEKELIVKELNKHGIDAILTTPENLTVDSINKYLEIKARGVF